MKAKFKSTAMKNIIKLLVTVFALAAFACTPSGNQSSNEKKAPGDSTQIQTPSDSTVTPEQTNDSSSIAK